MRDVKLAFFWLCKSAGLFRLARHLTRRQLKVLCYHGFEVADECRFRPKLFIKPRAFERRLATIRRLGLRVASLDASVDAIYAGTLADNTVVLTVDDGFYSTFGLAAPLLRQYGFPATVYVTTYYVENPNPVFRLVVQYMFFKTALTTLVLDGVAWSPDGTLDLSDDRQKEEAIDKCIAYGERDGSEAQRRSICEQLGELLQVPYSAIVEAKLFHLMTPAQLQSLEAAQVDIGLHTQRHTFSADSRELAEREITDNRAALARCGVKAVDHFCYPSGEWDPRQGEWLDGMGVKSSTTCLPGLNSASTPRHAIRRFLDGDNIHDLEFEAALSGFSDLLRRK